MDPNLIHVDWERTAEALTLIVIFSFIVERALALVFEQDWFIKRFDRSGVKELIAAVVSIAAVSFWKVDAVGMIALTSKTSIPGYVLTGLVVAGGSKASIKLFRDLMNFQSTASRVRNRLRAEAQADKIDEGLAKDSPDFSAMRRRLALMKTYATAEKDEDEKARIHRLIDSREQAIDDADPGGAQPPKKPKKND